MVEDLEAKMILDIKQAFDISYQCDHCKREPRMVTVKSLDEMRRALKEYGVYMCYRCESYKGEPDDKS